MNIFPLEVVNDGGMSAHFLSADKELWSIEIEIGS